MSITYTHRGRRPAWSRLLAYLGTAVCVVSLLSTCGKDSPTKPKEPGWYHLGFDDHWALKLELSWPYLYSCAADEGLFRQKLYKASTKWEYVGLADTTLGHWANRGVQDVLILSDRQILAAVIDGRENYPGLYRSDDDGISWARSDSGIPNPADPYASTITTLERSPCDPTVLFAGSAGAIYRSADEGQSWTRVGGSLRTGFGVNDIQVHQQDCNIVWAGGETSRFQEILWKSIDGGSTWEDVEIRQVVPHDNAVFRIALEPFDPDVAYIAMFRSIIKTTDGGTSWISPLPGFPRDGSMSAVVQDESASKHVFVSWGRGLFESWDGGQSSHLIESPNETTILDMVYDAKRGVLYVGTASGVYKYVVPDFRT